MISVSAVPTLLVGALTALPALGLAVAALFSWRNPRPAPGRAEPWVIGATVAAVLAALGLVALTLADPGRSVHLPVPGWGGAILQAAMALDVDVLAAVCLLMVTVVALVTCLRLLDGVVSVEALAGPLLVAAATALFVAAARVPLGLALSWLVLDAAILVGARGGLRGLLAGQVGFLCVLMGLFALPATATVLGGSSMSVADIGRLQLWLLLASAVRMGLYPIWWAVPRSDTTQPWRSALVRLAPTIAGGYLFLRATELARPGEALVTGALVPLALALVLSASLAWLARDAVEALDWRIATQAALVLLAIRPGGPVYRALGLLFLINLVLAGLTLYATADVRRDRTVIAARRIADAALWGVPLTLGFQARWLLYRELLEPVPFVLVLVAIGTALAARPRPAPGLSWIPALGHQRAVVVAGALLAGTLVVLGIAPWLLSPLVVSIAATDVPGALRDTASTLLSTTTWSRGLLLLGMILMPPLVGEALHRRPARRDPDAQASRLMAGRALRLTDVVDRAALGTVRAGAVIQQASGFIEGRRARVWTLLAAVVTGVIALRPPVSGGPAPTTAALIVFVLAGLVGAVMVLVVRPDVTLGALAAAYALSAAVLLLSGGPASVAGMSLVAGGVVVGILALGVLQTPIDRHLVRTARRLRAVSDTRSAPAGRLLPTLALIIALIIVFGIRSVSLPELLPTSVLQPALALGVGGVLAFVFARTPLKMACGVLLALAGFGLAYARLDPGVLIAAGLAVFQLLFAVVASYFVGPDSRAGEGA